MFQNMGNEAVLSSVFRKLLFDDFSVAVQWKKMSFSRHKPYSRLELRTIMTLR